MNMFEYLRGKINETPHIAVAYDLESEKSMNIELTRVIDGEHKSVIFNSEHFTFTVNAHDLETVLKKLNYTVFDKDIKLA